MIELYPRGTGYDQATLYQASFAFRKHKDESIPQDS